MFTPKRGPKEGRSHPGLPYANSLPSGRGRLNQRQILLILVVLVCFPLLYFVSHSGTATGPSVPGGANSRSERLGRLPTNLRPAQDSSKSEAETPGSRFVPPTEAIEDELPVIKKPESSAAAGSPPKADKSSKSDTPVKADTTVDEDDDDNPLKHARPAKSDSTKKHKQSPNAEKWSERPSFELALTKVIDMLPDEVHMRELTREVEGTGKERLREMGLRTRAYKKYFDAWEALHLTEDDEGSTYVRDDVVQYMRSHQHANTVSSTDESDDGGVSGMSLAQTIRSYEAYRAFMLKFAQLLFPWTAPYFSDHMSLHAHFKKGGRGIVLTAGDDQAPYLLTTIVTFRKLGCHLPIEVMYLGDQDLGEDYRMELEALDGVVTRDIAQMVNDEGWKLAGWAAKPFAILLSSFREVIFIDADSLFFRSPEVLFDEPGYKSTGALFFRDRMIMPESKKRWLQQVLPKPVPKLAKQSRFWTGESGHMQESGVVVIDKWRHFVPLLLVTRMNGPDRDGNKEQGKIGVYDMVYGDKETFWVGWLLAGDENYHFHEGDAGIMGIVKDAEDETRLPKTADHNPNPKLREQKSEGDQDREHDRDHGDSDQQPMSSDGDKDTDANDADTDAASSSSDSPSSSSIVARSQSPDNYTICAPQLLHLDTAGKPLWFNGWLLDNKFADRGKKRFATFESYLVEPHKVRDPGAWQLAESNLCCLTSDADKKFEFDDDERAVLKMIMDRAQEIGAYGDQ